MKNMTSKRETIKHLIRNFETKEDAHKRHTRIIAALQRDDGRGKRIAEQYAAFGPFNPDPLEEDARAKQLAAQLRRCGKGRQCNLSICPICLRRLRKSFILGAVSCLEELGLGPALPIIEFSAISVTDSQYLRDSLDLIDLRQINKRIRDQHERAGFPLAFAGVEISLSEDRQALNHPFWQAQVYGVVVGLEIEAVESAIKREYPSEASIPMPLWVRKCSNLAVALSDAIKPELVRRASCMDDAGRGDTRKFRLKKTQLKEVGLWLSLYEAPVRYVLTGSRRYSDRIKLNPGVRKHLEKLALAQNDGPN
jgi:hypothetical protein